MGAFYLTIDVLAALSATLLLSLWLKQKPGLPLPPGPPKRPLVGNLLDVPKDFPWLQYTALSKKYGGVISLSVLGQVIVVVSSSSAVKNVVLSRASKFTSRPYIKFVDMAGWMNRNLPLMPSGPAWRERRRVVDTYLRPSAIQIYQRIQHEKVTALLKRTISESNSIFENTREYNSAVVLDIVYGYETRGRDDYFVRANDEFQHLAERAVLPGALIVNTFPILGSLPPWMLGREFAQLLDKGRRMQSAFLDEPFEWTKERVKDGSAKESLVRTSLMELPSGDREQEMVLRESFGPMFGAAVDTTTSTITSMMYHLIMNPSVIAKAHDELDRIVGRERLPSFEDRPNLPYIEAIIMETFRVEPALPLGVPHTADEDVVADEYCIPKGAIVIVNTWAMLHDPENYEEPEKFKPERYISADGRVIEDPLLEYVFGFGVRKCPGRFFADATIWLHIVSLLAVFDVHKAKDANGTEIPLDGKSDPNSIIHGILPFPCSVVTRDSRARELVESV